MDKYIGRLLDNRYEILEVIGTGGMAVVYKARCHRLNRLVAIKILKDDFLEDEDFRRRFHSESQAVAMLSHPNIVAVYDVSTSPEADYIVMELIEGISLKQYMEMKGVLNWKETLHFAIQIAKALEHAHSRGIVHRDIKPHNVMVLKNGSVKVTDFGIARMMSKGNTLTKEALGSVHYISPEQAKGGRVDSRSDIYSLGVVMYEMITGRPPYDGESPVSVAIQHINGGAPMPSTLNPNIPGGLEQIIMKAMAHDPAERYPSATAMLADMDEFRKEPTMLFDYHTPPLDAVTKLTQKPLELTPNRTAPKTTAERVAGSSGSSANRSATGRNQPVRKTQEQLDRERRERRRRQQEEAARKNRSATIAIIVCSVVALIAIGVFVVILFSEFGTGEQPKELVPVPNLVGQKYEDIATLYPDWEIRLQTEVYDDTYEAGVIIDQEPGTGSQVEAGTPVFVTVSLGKETEPTYMENLVNISVDRAQEILNESGLALDVQIQEENSDFIVEKNVIRTEPEAGEPLTMGQTVVLYVSKGQEIKEVDMPNLVGLNVDTAMDILERYGFPVPELVPVYSSASENEVVKQSVERGEKVKLNTVIELEVSKGPEPTETTQPPDTEPTEPVPVKKDVTFTLPELTEETQVDICQGGEIVHSRTVSAGTKSIVVSLVGTGTRYYEVGINGEVYSSVEVVFTTDE